MSDNDAEDLSEFRPFLPEQYDDPNIALDLFDNYSTEEGKGPSTEQLLEAALHYPAESVEDNAINLVGGLLAVAAGLAAMWRLQGRTPQQVVEVLQRLLAPPAD